MFGEVAKENNFERVFGGWFKEFKEIMFVLSLQKSNYGKLYYLNIKLYIHGVFGNKYEKNKELVHVDSGDIFIRPPDSYSNLLELDNSLSEEDRRNGLKKMFEKYINPFLEKTKTKELIKEINIKGELFILPAVKKELGI